MRDWRLDDEEEGDRPKPDADAATAGGPIVGALFKSRTVLVFGEVNMRMAERVTAQLLALAAEGDGDIRVIINSPGGHVESGDTIHDVMRFCGPKVKAIGTGWVTDLTELKKLTPLATDAAPAAAQPVPRPSHATLPPPPPR